MQLCASHSRVVQTCSEPYVPLQVSGLKSSTSGSLAAFDRMEQKVVAMEAEADAAGQVGSAYTSFCTVLCAFWACMITSIPPLSNVLFCMLFLSSCVSDYSC